MWRLFRNCFSLFLVTFLYALYRVVSGLIPTVLLCSCLFRLWKSGAIWIGVRVVGGFLLGWLVFIRGWGWITRCGRFSCRWILRSRWAVGLRAVFGLVYLSEYCQSIVSLQWWCYSRYWYYRYYCYCYYCYHHLQIDYYPPLTTTGSMELPSLNHKLTSPSISHTSLPRPYSNVS